MIPVRERGAMEPILLQVKKIISKKKKNMGVEIAEEVVFNNALLQKEGMQQHTILYLQSNFSAPDVQKWLLNLLCD